MTTKEIVITGYVNGKILCRCPFCNECVSMAKGTYNSAIGKKCKCGALLHKKGASKE